MKRSEINLVYREARECFRLGGWNLPPAARWDITDFGLDDFNHFGLTLINLATEPEYCEKLMYARRNQTTPCHTHARKKEDIICRAGALALWLWPRRPNSETEVTGESCTVAIDGVRTSLRAGVPHILGAGSRITLVPGVYHAFAPTSDDCIIGEVSTANDDEGDNFFINPGIGRYPSIQEDEPAQIRLISE